MLEDADYVEGKQHSCNIKFPEFEVDMESLGVTGRVDMMDEVLCLENIGIEQVMQSDEVISNNKELLGSVESDLIKYLLHHSVETDCLEGTNMPSPVDCISIIELSHHEPYSESWTVEPTLFDEFMFFDLDLFNFCEVFSVTTKEIKHETCEYMFGEAMNFRSFSQLVVCHELTLLDDSFKSLPVPILSEHGNTSSLHILIDELLARSNWQPSSASDGLYLDWHFLGEGDCESAKYSACLKMLWEINTYDIDIDTSLSSSGRVIFDFILSEGHSSKPNSKKDMESLDLCCIDVPVLRSSGKADLSGLKNQADGERKNDGILLKSGVENVQMFGESMSSDLEFFLNPRNFVMGKEKTPADKPVDTKTVSQGCIFAGDSAAASSTTVLQQKLSVKKHTVSMSTNILQLTEYFKLEKFPEIYLVVLLDKFFDASEECISLSIQVFPLTSQLFQRSSFNQSVSTSMLTGISSVKYMISFEDLNS